MLWNKICSTFVKLLNFNKVKNSKDYIMTKYKVSLDVVRKANNVLKHRQSSSAGHISSEGISVRVNTGKINKIYEISSEKIKESYKLALHSYADKV
jgi:hypothetical protein